MSTSVIEPGTRLAGRYRLEEKCSEAGGSTLWKAIDEILARAVAVRTFEPDFPRAAEVVTAARTASRLTDPRLTQVFDADDTGELAYVVSEWVSGESLEDMITADGPLESGRATRFVSEAAEALTAAHNAGMSHLCLTARNLVWTTGGTVKLTGLGVDAVLCGVSTPNPGRLDALGLGQMLYAALTGRWPGSADESSLPLADEEDGEFVLPRAVRDTIPAEVEAIVLRSMELGEQESPLTTPAEVAAALTKVPRTPLPLFAGLQTGPPPAIINRPPRDPQPTKTVPQPRPVPAETATTALPSSAIPAPVRQAPGEAKPLNRPLIAGASALAVLVIVFAAWKIGGGSDEKPGPGATGGPGATASTNPSASAGTKLSVSNATGFFELTAAGQGHPDSKAEGTASKIIDGSKSTYFETDGYGSSSHAATYGNYLKGVGVVLNIGKSKSISRIVLSVPTTSVGASYEVYIGDVDNRTGVPKAKSGRIDTTSTEIKLDSPTNGQYVILWFPKGPPTGKLQVGDAAVYGTG
ncbi:AMP-binding protein [Actinocorallia longicatena]|uniref:Protein kinase family protein n=1 Tax=Actinocorallia longicatena TaxID=111803 RepID=A0ABP6Q9S5_9ACTN